LRTQGPQNSGKQNRQIDDFAKYQSWIETVSVNFPESMCRTARKSRLEIVDPFESNPNAESGGAFVNRTVVRIGRSAKSPTVVVYWTQGSFEVTKTKQKTPPAS
jgi:hypothetical protein